MWVSKWKCSSLNRWNIFLVLFFMSETFLFWTSFWGENCYHEYKSRSIYVHSYFPSFFLCHAALWSFPPLPGVNHCVPFNAAWTTASLSLLLSHSLSSGIQTLTHLQAQFFPLAVKFFHLSLEKRGVCGQHILGHVCLHGTQLFQSSSPNLQRALVLLHNTATNKLNSPPLPHANPSPRSPSLSVPVISTWD